MARARIITAAATVACFALASVASAQLDDHVWVGGTGNQLWQLNTNWNPTPFPNDPGRVDPDPTIITNVVGANLAVNLPANLSVDVGATDVTVASLTMGSTGSPVTTNITSGGGRLVFENFEANNTAPEPDVCAFNCGAAQITTAGVAGATNTITANIGVNDHIDVTGAKPLTIAGNVQEMAGSSTTGDVSLRAKPGSTIFINGGITTLDIPTGANTEDVPMQLNSAIDSQGTIEVNSVITGSGRMGYGTTVQNSNLPLGNIYLRGANTYSGRTILSRGNLYLDNNSALGTGDFKQEGPAAGSQQTGYNLFSTDDGRTIANNMVIGQWQTVKGDHSLKWTGRVIQTNDRGWINMLAPGKTLTLTGQQYTFELADGLLDRTLIFDGTGKTKITGGVRNRWDSDLNVEAIVTYVGNLRVRGSGTVVIDGDNAVPDSDSNFNGSIIVEGSNLHFATNGDFGIAARVASEAGAVGVDSGVVNNSVFLALINNSSNPAADAAGNLVVFDRGGLMLAPGEYGSNLDFTTGDLANASGMSLAAQETGSTYTGTIMPAANTYRLGGGSGTLTLPGVGVGMTPNQLTGARNVVATNGGEVKITNTNNYTGTTSISAKYVSTLQNAAAADTPTFVDGDNIPNDQIYLGTTLTASTLADGGVASSIGSSSNVASNLYIQGSTLKYTGGATSTDRLFTIGSGGATIDASGTGALNLTNTGPLGVDLAEARTGTINAFAGVNGALDATTVRKMTSTEDLRPGMPIMASGIPAGALITRIVSPTEVTFSIANTSAFALDTPVTFGPAPERKLTLTGMNGGNNTLAAVIPNASDGGPVGVTKTGDGKWILTANNSYGGTTTVSAGTLVVNGNHTGTGAVTVAAGATLGGNGTLPGLVTNNGTINAGNSVGELKLAGGLVMGTNSKLTVELGPASFDKLTITGILDLSALGNAVEVFDLGKTDTSWIIATFTGALTGTFETVTSGYSLAYGANNITLNFAGGVQGDYNNNGTVDAADYVLWRSGGPLLNDPTPGVQNPGDYDFWRSRFGATSNPGSSSGSSSALGAVPEPAGALLAMLAVAGIVCLGRRKRHVAVSV